MIVVELWGIHGSRCVPLDPAAGGSRASSSLTGNAQGGTFAVSKTRATILDASGAIASGAAGGTSVSSIASSAEYGGATGIGGVGNAAAGMPEVSNVSGSAGVLHRSTFGGAAGVENDSTYPGAAGADTANRPGFIEEVGSVGVIASAECVTKVDTLPRAASKFVLVVDASSSMRESAPGAAGQSQWIVLRNALTDAVMSFDENDFVGLLLYPNMVGSSVATTPGSASDCIDLGSAVPLGRMGYAESNQRMALVNASLINDSSLGASRPTEDAYYWATSEMIGRDR